MDERGRVSAGSNELFSRKRNLPVTKKTSQVCGFPISRRLQYCVRNERETESGRSSKRMAYNETEYASLAEKSLAMLHRTRFAFIGLFTCGLLAFVTNIIVLVTIARGKALHNRAPHSQQTAQRKRLEIRKTAWQPCRYLLDMNTVSVVIAILRYNFMNTFF